MAGMNRKSVIRLYVLAAAVPVAVLALAGCSQSARDVEGVPNKNADSYVLLNNVDKYPNMVVVCYAQTAFVTTQREAAGAIMRVPELDKTCPGYVAPSR